MANNTGELQQRIPIAQIIYDRWPAIMLVGVALAVLGYWSPWIAHPTTGLTLIGVDLAEIVKFLRWPAGTSLTLPRETFYLPLAASGATLLLLAHTRASLFTRWVRTLMTVCALALALAMLPPAWSPDLLRRPEFRMQVAAIGILVLLPLASPIIARLPEMLIMPVLALASVAAVIPTLLAFLETVPAIRLAYQTPFNIGIGPWLLAGGWTLVLLSAIGWTIVAKRIKATS